MTKAAAPRKPILPLLDIDEDLDTHLCQKVAEFHGQLNVLESAIGALVLGQQFGLDVLRMVHSPATLRKYESALDIKYKEHCPGRTTLSTKNRGINAADALGGIWKVITGKVTVKGKGDVTNDD